MARNKTAAGAPSPRRRPATTIESRENQMVALAFDLVEKRLLEGTATSQETTHFLKLGTTNAELERDKLKGEVAVLKARVESMASASRNEELFANAIEAMRNYGGHKSEGP